MKEKLLKRLNAKHETFISYVFEGEEKGKAFNLAFGDDEDTLKKAEALLADPLIKKRLSEKREEALEEEKRNAFKTRERIIRELEAVAFADINDFYPFMEGFDEDRENLSLENIPREKRGAIASVTKGKGGITLKLNDKFKAIELLEKELSALEGQETVEKGDDEIKVSIKVC